MDGQTTAPSWGADLFGAVELGDARRTKRLVRIADRLRRHPGGTLPDKLSRPADLKAFYDLMNTDTVTHAVLITAAAAATPRAMADATGTVLLLADATELDYSGLASIPTRGRLGNGKQRGDMAHNVLAVVADTREVLGLAYQHLVERAEPAEGETRAARRDRADRESRWWKEAREHPPVAPAGKRSVEVGDRGADVLEFLDYLERAGKQYLVRARHNRRIGLENGTSAKPFDYARSLPEGGRRTVEVPPAAGREGRTATVAVSWAKVSLKRPAQPRGEVKSALSTTWVVWVREVDPPAGVEPLEWVLLTDVPVGDAADAFERVDGYAVRWVIEESHEGMKTGCGVEPLRFTTEAALHPTIALLSVTAVTRLRLRDLGRRSDAATTPAVTVVDPTLVAALCWWRWESSRTPESVTVAEFVLALGRLGGHQNRKHDGPPGWLTLWRGWMKLQLKAEVTSPPPAKRCG